MTDATAATGRFEKLSGFLAHDPDNLNLLADTAGAAFAEDRFDEAEAILRRYAALADLPTALKYLAGLIAMRLEAWDRAVERFEILHAAGEDGPPVRFNLAWSLSMEKRFAEALPLLDDATSDSLPQAAQLEVQLLHELGEFDRAGERARFLIEVHPDHRGLNAAASTLAIDIEDAPLALRTAQKAGDHPDALATLGTLALGEDQPEIALQLFDAALERNPQAPRAWIGRGLVNLLGDDKALAAQDLDRGAGLFGSHVGSWVAAGWAHVLAGDLETARARFDTALSLDDNFGETQGSLAVIDLLEGRTDEARKRTEIALRLDRKGFAAALASMLLAAGDGNADKAKRIFEIALTTPVDVHGRTVAQSLARLGMRAG